MRPVSPREPWDGRTVMVGQGVEPLPAVAVRTERGTEIRTEWELDFLERAAILNGARIVLTFLGGVPPCRIEVDGIDAYRKAFEEATNG